MSASRKQTTTANLFNTLCIEDAPKHAEAMLADLSKLQEAVLIANTEFTIYSEQKEFIVQNFSTESVTRCQSLFAGDFQDFKAALNATIRQRNEIHENWKLQLGLLPKESSFLNELAKVDSILHDLKKVYARDKSLYTNLPQPTAPTPVAPPVQIQEEAEKPNKGPGF